MGALDVGAIDGAVMFEPYLEMAKKFKQPKFTVPHEFALTCTIEAYAVVSAPPQHACPGR